MNMRLWYVLLFLPTLLTAQEVIETDSLFHSQFTPYTAYELTQDQIRHMPVRGLYAYLQLFNGVIIQDGNLHVRGGRDDETGFYVNGLSTTDPLDNSNAMYIIPEAIEQIHLYPGVYSARYGGANSGIVLTDLKQGTSNYRFSFNVQTDKFAAAGGKFLGTYSYRDQIVTATASGPIYFDNLRFFAAVENTGIGDNVKRFGHGFRFDDLVDENVNNPEIFYGDPDTVSLNYPTGFTPFNSTNRWAINSVINYDLNPFSLQMTFLYNHEKVYENNVPIFSMLNRRQQYMQYDKWIIAADFTHRLSADLYYSVGISSFVNEAERFDDWFGNEWQAWDDSARVADYTNGAVQYRRQYFEPYQYNFSYFYFYRNGHTLENYEKTSSTCMEIHADATWQINSKITLQGGIFRRGYTIRQFAVQQNYYMQQFTASPADEDDLWWYTDNVYGYDLYGHELDSGFDGPREPVFAGGYVETRWQTNTVHFTAGLRLDYFNTADRSLKDPLNKYLREQGYRLAILQNAWQQKDAEIFVSPRLGFKTQTSKRTQIFAAYAKTVQPVSLSQIYYGTHAINRQFYGGYYYLYPVGFDMSTMSAQHIDVGLRHQFAEKANFYLTGFYKKTTGQVRVSTLFWGDPSRVQVPDILENRFFILTNGDESTSRGLEMGLSVFSANGIRAELNYTFTSAEGTGSNAYSNYTSIYREPVKYDTTTFAYTPLDFEVKHNFLLNVSYSFAPEKGGILFENSTLSLLMRMKSGHPYTNVQTYYRAFLGGYSADYELDRRNNAPLEPINASVTPWIYTVDLGFEKSFSIYAHTRATFFVRVTNLLNTKNVINVYTASNAADSDGFLDNVEKERYNTWFGEQFSDFYQTINMENGQSYWQATGRQLYGHPRQILFGMRIAY